MPNRNHPTTTHRRRAVILPLFFALINASSIRAQGRVEIGAKTSGVPGISAAESASSRFAVLPVGFANGNLPAPLVAAPAITEFVSPTPSVRAVTPSAASPVISPHTAFTPPATAASLFPAAKSKDVALPESVIVGRGAATAAKGSKDVVAVDALSKLDPSAGSDEDARAAGNALFDARRQHLQADDAAALMMSGYRFNEVTGRILAPQTGEPLTNTSVRALQNQLNEGRGRRTLLRLAHETGPGGSVERKDALTAINRDVLPREVLKARKVGPEKERATILRRAASLYRRWLERAPFEGDEVVVPANAEAEEKLGALVASAAVKRFSDDPEGVRLLDQLRDAHGKLRLPTMRVLRLDERYGALYASYGRQLVLSLNYVKRLLLAKLPEAERVEAEKRISTEEGALEYLLQSPARVAALAEALDVTLFHELVHFRQDLERPLMTAVKEEEAPGLLTLEHEYEAYFRQDLYIHSRLSHPDARLDIERLDDYLRLIDNFDTWKAQIDSSYTLNFLNGTTAMDELEKLQGESRQLIQRLAGPENHRSAAASKRLMAAARGTDAVAAEKKAAEAELAEYRQRWPALARDGLRRWLEINEGLGRLPQVAFAQDRLARLAGSLFDAVIWNEKARESANSALLRLAQPDGLSTDERVEWINALATRSNSFGIPWQKEIWVAILRDFAQKARELHVEAGKSAEGPAKIELLRRAREFESAVDTHRATLRVHAETNLASARVEADPARRAVVIEWGSMQADVLGDTELSASFQTIAKIPVAWPLPVPL